MENSVASIAENYGTVLGKIGEAARRAGRAPEAVRVVVVTKLQPVAMVRAALEAGVLLLGENYPEEGARKIQELQPTSWPGVEWHMIGHVQSRKAGIVASWYAMVHSLDSVKLAGRLDREAASHGRKLPVLLEFNVGGEAEKHGWPAVREVEWPGLLPDVETIVSMKNLEVHGLMTMPPLTEDPEVARGYFRRLRRLQEYLAARNATADWSELSMGTSADFEVAVEEGATLVRVGQAILGPRPGAISP
jgi:pyridoxal phosphate enzyme (YggS family)